MNDGLPVIPPHLPRTHAEVEADRLGRPVRWRGRVIYPAANRPRLPGQ